MKYMLQIMDFDLLLKIRKIQVKTRDKILRKFSLINLAKKVDHA